MSSNREWLLVSEMFETLQGEGPTAGTPAYFVRLGACDLACKWCDTPYTWAFGDKAKNHEQWPKQYSPSEEFTRIPIEAVALDVHTARMPLCVITGGEPLLQLFAVDRLISTVNEYPVPIQFEIETAGTHYPAALEVYDNLSLNVSPKLASSGNDIRKRYHPDVLRKINTSFRNVRFKFVPDTRPTPDMYERVSADVREIGKIVRECEIPNDRVWLMPCGTTAEAVIHGMTLLSRTAMDRNWRLTSRLHVLMWGDERGR